MIFKEELQKFAKIIGFNLWQTEKDYLQHVFLFFLSKESKDEFVFKGGSALQKVHGLNRFSIDLDFTLKKDEEKKAIEKVCRNMRDFGLETEIKRIEEFKELGRTFVLKIKGPLYDGTEKTLTILRIEISHTKDLFLEPEVKEIIPIYPDIPPYFILVMKLEEILAEKVRAIFWRSKSRDVYDLWFILRKNADINFDLINRKLEYYKMSFSLENFEKKIEECRENWENELKQTVSFVPRFENVKKEIIENFERRFHGKI